MRDLKGAIEYELVCGCGIVKHERTRVNILKWYLEHKKTPDVPHYIETLVWFYGTDFRIMGKEEIDEAIEYITSGKAEDSDRKYPWGDPGLGAGIPGPGT